MKTLSAKDVKAMMDRHEDFHLIDVLPHEHHRQKHIPGSVNVPVEAHDFLGRVEHIAKDKNERVVVYCADEGCNASSTAASKLEEVGYRDVYDLAGGVKEWEDASYRLEGSFSSA